MGYLRAHLQPDGSRRFTGIKYHRITSRGGPKQPYQRAAAMAKAVEQARHFLACRQAQVRSLQSVMARPPVVVAPYDAELFGHWWYEGPEFLDYLVRKVCCDQEFLELITPEDYLRRHPTNQIATPSPSSWGEQGHFRVWLNERNQWIYPHLQVAQERMAALARRLPRLNRSETGALRQAARELLLAQSSDWSFMLRSETCPVYARQRVGFLE